MTDQLTDGEKQTLLRLAREAMEHGVRGRNFHHWIKILLHHICARMARPLLR